MILLKKYCKKLCYARFKHFDLLFSFQPMRILHTLQTDNFLYKNVDWETLPKQKIIPFWGPGLESEAHHKFRKRKLKKTIHYNYYLSIRQKKCENEIKIKVLKYTYCFVLHRDNYWRWCLSVIFFWTVSNPPNGHSVKGRFLRASVLSDSYLFTFSLQTSDFWSPDVSFQDKNGFGMLRKLKSTIFKREREREREREEV